MTVIGVHGCKQAPGVTTLTLALAAALDADGGAIVVEADAAGGDIAALLGRPATPGLVTLAAAGRNGGAVDVDAHLLPLPAGGRVLLAPSEPSRVGASLAAIGPRVVELLGGVAAHVIVDHGRGLEPGRQDVAVIVCHPTVAGVEQARVRADLLDGFGANVAIAISTVGPYRADEVASVLGRPVVAAIPWDARGAAALVGTRRVITRSPLLRAATSLGDELRALDHRREPAW